VRIFLLFLVLCLAASVSRASHAMGGEISYDYVSGSTYLLRFTLYRDCSGTPADSAIVLSYSSAQCATGVMSYTLYAATGIPTQITPICSGMLTTCNGGAYVGVEKWIYEDTVDLGVHCSDWSFACELCCRNSAITNLVNPSAQHEYFYATLNNLDVPFNNSVRFANSPVPFLFGGSSYISNGAWDIDHDSIAVTLTTPLGASGAPLTFISPFTYQLPVTGSINVNGSNGNTAVVTNQSEVDVLAKNFETAFWLVHLTVTCNSLQCPIIITNQLFR